VLEPTVDAAAPSRPGGRPAPSGLAEAPRHEIWFKHRIHLRTAFQELWEYKPMIRSLAERDIRVRYKQAVLGMAWAVFTPIVMMLAFTLVFTKFGHVATGGIPYPLFSYIALIPWNFFSSGVLSGGMSLMANIALLNKLYCPREVFPLGAVAVAAVDALVATLVLVVLFPIEGATPHIETLYVPVMLVTLVALTVGATLATAAIVVYMRDLRVALPLVMQLALFVTPVAYGASTIARSRSHELVYAALNPLVPVMDGLRKCVLLGQQPDWTLQLIGLASALVVLAGGYLLFKRLETGLADIA
jgi:ABC-2 type transport system permease protein/lipopolysaccharide transport system permease protein